MLLINTNAAIIKTTKIIVNVIAILLLFLLMMARTAKIMTQHTNNNEYITRILSFKKMKARSKNRSLKLENTFDVSKSSIPSYLEAFRESQSITTLYTFGF
jgi:hypothetical protein